MNKPKQYRVYDWAGNDLTSFYGTFEHFEDAWGAVRENIPDEESWQEFYVEEVN
jgi:hypothetical protein